MSIFAPQVSRSIAGSAAELCLPTLSSSGNDKDVIRRRRRPNFSHEELRALVKAVESRNHLAEGKIFGNFESHRQAWFDVANEVHAKTGGYLGGGYSDKSQPVARTATELRIKWIDLSCRVRQKWRARLDGHNVRDNPCLQMSPLELNVLAILKKTGSGKYKGNMGYLGKVTVNPRYASKSSSNPSQMHLSYNRSSLPSNASCSASSPATVPKVNQVRINGFAVRSTPILNNPTPKIHKRPSQSEVIVMPVPSQPVEPPRTIITIPDESSSAENHNGEESLLSGLANGEDNVFNYENGWREMAVRQDQVIELLRELLQENVRRRAVEEETLNLLKTFVSLQARSVELKEFKLGLTHQSEEYCDVTVKQEAPADISETTNHIN